MKKMYVAVVFLVGVSLCSGAQAAQNNSYIQKYDGTSVVDTATPIYESSGKIGIGTTSPATGFVLQTGTNGLTEVEVKSTITSGGTWAIGTGYTTAGAGNFYLYDAIAGALRLVADTSGNFGIGTTSPAYKLDINGTGNFVGNFKVGTNALFVDATNNYVGIGTTTPAHALDVVGSAKVTGNAFAEHLYIDGAISVGTTLSEQGTGTVQAAFGAADNSSATAYYKNNTNWWTTSDGRLKKNIQPLTGALDILELLHPVEFEWEDNLVNQAGFGPGKHLGFIAQDVEVNFPRWVQDAAPPSPNIADVLPADQDVKGLNLPMDYYALVVQGINELRGEKDSLNRMVQDLKALACGDQPDAPMCKE